MLRSIRVIVMRQYNLNIRSYACKTLPEATVPVRISGCAVVSYTNVQQCNLTMLNLTECYQRLEGCAQLDAQWYVAQT
jgi:hypothetical protein